MKFHIVVEEGMQLAPEQLLHFQESGTKCITFRTGNDYFMTIENIMFRQGPKVRCVNFTSLFRVHPCCSLCTYVNVDVISKQELYLKPVS